MRAFLLTTGCWVLAFPSISLAAPSQEDVFRSIQDNLSEPSDPSKVLAVVLAAVAMLLLLVLLSQRRQREVLPRPLNHPGKLLKEVSRAVNLRPAEVRQLKILADAQKVSSPITLLLCPSVLSRAMKSRAVKVDPQLVSSAVRKVA